MSYVNLYYVFMQLLSYKGCGCTMNAFMLKKHAPPRLGNGYGDSFGCEGDGGQIFAKRHIDLTAKSVNKFLCIN